MQFGTPVLSTNKSLQSTFERTEKGFLALTVIQIGSFIFERPDNGKVIIEIVDTLAHESPENVFPLTHQTAEHFKTLIADRYKQLIADQLLQLNDLAVQTKETKLKIKELEALIQNVEAKNKEAFSETRAKSIQQQTKALRKHQNRLKAIAVNVHATEAKVIEYEHALEYSLEKASIQLEKALFTK